ncbi:hypothetical protein QX25_13260 [Stutzerimonas stutzeri]|jgi:uncharacterized membrane protein YhaH (DUF805 family)|nr:hypothetical protein QX25_13260 [Stutzerimonas stutzeri]
MTQSTYRIVFSGQCASGTAPEDVKRNLATLFKTDEARFAAFFDGAERVLKKGLSADQAARYLAALQHAGALARREAEAPPPSLSLMTIEASTEAGPGRRMTCPKCQTEQPQAEQCSHCSIFIDKYLARQAALSQTAAAATSDSPYAPPRTQLDEPPAGFAELKVFSLKGRIGRLRYLAWSLVAMMALVALVLAIMPLFAWLAPAAIVLAVVIISAAAVVNVQIGVQRLHDMNLSGWLMLLHFVPVVGSLMPLVLAAVPGKAGNNRFGAPPPPNGTAVKVLAALWLLVLIGAFFTGTQHG